MKIARNFAFLVASVLLAHWLYTRHGAGALLGFDGYPLIAASRVEGLASFFGMLTDELMGGRYPDGSFYRPLVHLSFAVDDWASGGTLDPGAFRRTDVVIAGFAAALVGGVAGRLTVAFSDNRSEAEIAADQPDRGHGVAVIAAGVIAALTYLLHRAQLDVVPYAPRRADALCVLFLAAAVFETLGGKRLWSVAVLSACAFFSKETGAIVVPLVAVAGLAVPGRGRALAVASAVSVAASIGLRTLVLGGLGGHAESGTAQAAEGAASVMTALWKLLALEALGGAPVVVGLLVVTTACVGCAHRAGRTTVALVVTWSLAVLALTAFSGRAHMWYVIALLPGVAIMAGVGLGAALARRSPMAIAGGVAGVALMTSLSLEAVAGGRPQHQALGHAGSIAADQVKRFQAVAEEAQPGARIVFQPWVFAIAGSETAAPIYLHSPYSLQALADLLRPDLEIAVGPPGTPQPSHGAAVIELVPGAPPASASPH